MTIDNKLRNEKLQYNINRESAKQQQRQQKNQHYYLEKLTNMNILKVKKYYPLVEDKQ